MTALKLKSPPVPLEREDQCAYFEWLSHFKFGALRVWEYAFAVPNGSYLHGNISQRAMQSNSLKRQGVKNVVPDIVIPIPVGPYHGFFLEMKRLGGVPSDISDAQTAWHIRLDGVGYCCQTAFGFNQARILTETYFLEKSNGWMDRR